jgi:hypothetical protein
MSMSVARLVALVAVAAFLLELRRLLAWVAELLGELLVPGPRARARWRRR